MKKIIFVFLFLTSCSHLPRRIDIPSPGPEPTPTPSVLVGTPIPVPSPWPFSGMKFQCDDYCTPFEVTRLAKAEKKGNDVIRSQCFKDFWMKTKILCLQNDEEACPNLKSTNAELYADLIAVTKSVPVHYYYQRTSTIGYRNEGQPDVYFNRKFHDSYSVCDTASNAFHEGTHSTLEWSHTMSYYTDRDYSPPYRVNAGFDQCCVD